MARSGNLTNVSTRLFRAISQVAWVIWTCLAFCWLVCNDDDVPAGYQTSTRYNAAMLPLRHIHALQQQAVDMSFVSSVD